MIGWFDIAYIVLNIMALCYCFKIYSSSKRKPFRLLALGFLCPTTSNLLWILTIYFSIASLLRVYEYLCLGLYAAFLCLTLYALQQLNLK
jgi:hypothetical protein